MSEARILHLSTSKLKGAGIAALKLHEYLMEASFTSHFVTPDSSRKGEIYQKLEMLRKRIVPDRLWNLIIRKNEARQKYSLHSIDDYKLNTNAEIILKKVPFEPNIIIIHWVSGFINSKTIKELYKLTHARIFWTMMDNAPITGGCHYPWSCKGYQNECGRCPGLESNDESDLSNLNLVQKKTVLKDVDISLIAFSESDFDRARLSSAFAGKKIFKLILPVDETSFKPSDSLIYLRKKWKIPFHYKVLLLGASNVQDHRKGITLFYDAWEKSALRDTVILLIGKADRECLQRLGEKTVYAGSVNEKTLIECYQMADYFVCPSLEDSGPYMINQSLMCGTPVVAFNIGVAVDLVKTGETGYNCGSPSISSLVEGLKFMSSLSPEENAEIKNRCREIAVHASSKSKFLSSFAEMIK